MKASNRRLLTVIIIAAIAVLALAYGFWPRAVPVEAAKAIRGPLRVTIEEEGVTRVKNRFIVSAPVAGIIDRVQLEVGDRVKKGDMLFEMSPVRPPFLDPRTRAEAEAAAAAAAAALRAAQDREQAARAQADYAAQQFARYERLLKKEAVARQQYELAEAEAKQSKAAYEAAQAATAAARADLARDRSTLSYSAAKRPSGKAAERVVVRSPRSGAVLQIHRESEGAVNLGESILDIGDPEDIEVRVDLLSSDAVKVDKGTPVVFDRWGGGEPLNGVVKTVEPSGFTKTSSLGVEEQRVMVIVEFTSDVKSRPQLGDGYRIEASFIIWQGNNVLQIPESALFRWGEKWAVFEARGNRARRRIVEVGHRNGLQAEILSGLAQGAAVITQPEDTIKDGGRIKIRAQI